MSIPTVEGGGTLLGIMALVILELVKKRKNDNWGNPMVLAIKSLEVTMRTCLSEHDARCNERIRDHAEEVRRTAAAAMAAAGAGHVQR